MVEIDQRAFEDLLQRVVDGDLTQTTNILISMQNCRPCDDAKQELVTSKCSDTWVLFVGRSGYLSRLKPLGIEKFPALVLGAPRFELAEYEPGVFRTRREA